MLSNSSIFFFKQMTAYEMRISDWSSDVCSSDLLDQGTVSDLERIRQLLDELEGKQDLVALLEGARAGDGMKIFIGSENKLFSLSGSSVIAAPYFGSEGKVVGVVGVIGPTRLNYARVIPMVAYTAQALTREIGKAPCMERGGH